jgi:hypothetical protein
MNADLETRLRDALEERAATTTVSPDGWARVNRRVERHGHRRSVVLKLAAAAVLVVVLTLGAVALLGRDPGSGRTVASGDAASKSAARDSGTAGAESHAGGGESPQPALPAPANGTDVVVRHRPDGTVVARRLGVETRAVPAGELTAAVGSDGVVFGVLPEGAGTVRMTADAGAGVIAMASATLAPASGGFRTFSVAGFGAAVGPVRVEAGGQTTTATDGGTRR